MRKEPVPFLDRHCYDHLQVAQTSSLLYRKASSLRIVEWLDAVELAKPCRLEVDDTAGWKLALREQRLAFGIAIF